jgi:hypothetical protein
MILLALVSVGAFATFVFVMRGWRARRSTRRTETPEDRCACGYLRRGLDTIRCPECGRVAGFDATAEELGLTDEQLAAAKRRRDARRRQEGLLGEPPP